MRVGNKVKRTKGGTYVTHTGHKEYVLTKEKENLQEFCKNYKQAIDTSKKINGFIKFFDNGIFFLRYK